VLASAGKALFLSNNDIDLLPWMFMGSALFTVFVSITYVFAMDRFPVEFRFPVLLGFAGLSFVGLHLAFPSDPKLVSILIFLWCPAIGYLISVQAWNMTTATLPTRQAKRLMPVLASIATLGAVGGGALVQVLLTFGGAAEDLILLAVALLLWPLVSVNQALKRLRRPESKKSSTRVRASDTGLVENEASEGGLIGLFKTPLLKRLAWFVFFAQAASILVDFQFSAELQARYDKDTMAAFLGAYYWIANLSVFVVALFVTSRVVRTMGIAVGICFGVFSLFAGSGLYLFAGITGLLPTFWVIAGTAFAERIGHFAITRSSTQMLVMPLATHVGERVKTLVDGVAYKLASVLIASLLLIYTPKELHILSVLVLLAAVGAILVARGIGDLYQNVLLDALKARRVQGAVTRYLRDGLGRRTTRDMEERLNSTDPHERAGALRIIRDLALPIRPRLLLDLANSGDVQECTLALECLDSVGYQPNAREFVELLSPDRPPEILRTLLTMMQEIDVKEVDSVVLALTRHSDPGVVALAGMYRMRVQGGYTTQEIELEVERRGGEIFTDVHARPPRKVTGQMEAVEIARDLPLQLVNGSLEEKKNAIRNMGQLSLPTFVKPLIDALDNSELRPDAADALQHFSPSNIPSLVASVCSEMNDLGSDATILVVLERRGGSHGAEALQEIIEKSRPEIRSLAVAALWRMERSSSASVVDQEWVQSVAQRELTLLRTYLAIEASAPPATNWRTQFFGQELKDKVVAAEIRVFLLLGMIYPRDAMYRAQLHYRSQDTRERQNAVELLDQHIEASVLRAFVGIVERREGISGDLNPRSTVTIPVLSAHSPIQLIEENDPWLKKVFHWTRAEFDPVEKPDYGEAMSRCASLVKMDLFEGLTGQQLFHVAQGSRIREVAAGEILVHEGVAHDELWVLFEGEAVVRRGGIPITRLENGDCFGLLSLVHTGPYQCTVETTEPCRMMAIERDRFQDLMDRHPSLSRGVIRLLTQRIRLYLTDSSISGWTRAS
jgi:hypothetical protein